MINSDLNGNLESDFNNRKINVWNYNLSDTGKLVDFSTFQDNTNNTSTRFNLSWPGGPIYENLDKDFYESIYDTYNNIEAHFRPIIEYRE